MPIGPWADGFGPDQCFPPLCRLRVHQRLREDVLCLPEAGAPRQALQHHEGDQPPARQTAHDPVSADGAELVSRFVVIRVVEHLYCGFGGGVIIIVFFPGA